MIVMASLMVYVMDRYSFLETFLLYVVIILKEESCLNGWSLEIFDPKMHANICQH